MTYFTFGQTQEIISEHYSKTGKGLSFREATVTLKQRQELLDDKPQKPDFLSWDNNLETLKEKIYAIPLDVKEIEQVQDIYQKQQQTHILSQFRSVQITLESIYAPEAFTNLPYITILYVIRGQANLTTETSNLQLDEGDLVILGPHLSHRLFCTAEDLVINILSSTELFQEHFHHILTKHPILAEFFQTIFYNGQQDLLAFHLPVNRQILSTIKHLFDEFLTDDWLATEAFLYHLQIFYTELLRNGHSQTKLKKQISPLPNILLYLQHHYREVTLTSLAQAFSYTPSYLSRLIKRDTGKTLGQIKTDLKLQEATSLLRYSPYSIEKIAELVGFNSADHFAYTFKQKYGLSPTAFRQSDL